MAKELSVFVDESGDWGEYDYHPLCIFLSGSVRIQNLFQRNGRGHFFSSFCIGMQAIQMEPGFQSASSSLPIASKSITPSASEEFLIQVCEKFLWVNFTTKKAAWEYTKRIADLHLQSMRNDQPVSLYERRSVNGIFTVRLFCRDSRPDAVRLSRLFRAVSHTAGENSPA